MQKLIPVEEAKALMTEAQGWSVWGWLTEKRRLRTTADKAWEALEEMERNVRDSWSAGAKKAYRELEAEAALAANPRSRRAYEKARDEAKDVDPQIKLAVERAREMLAEAHTARMTAEETFDEAERRMSTTMACEGARQAIDAWKLREKAIRKLEAVARET